jgi:hypothetical protein
MKQISGFGEKKLSHVGHSTPTRPKVPKMIIFFFGKLKN